MMFQPFGFRFDIASPKSPSEVKAVIRSRKKAWLDSKDGARGWIVGPLICLWFSAFDRTGPMLWGWISQDDAGTKINGRVGSNLNSVLLWLFLPPLFILWLVVGDGSPGLIVVTCMVMLPISALGLWIAHKDHRDAEPLVRFIQKAVTPSDKPDQKKPAGVQTADVRMSKPVSMIVSGEKYRGAVTPATIHEALLGLESGDFLILEADPQTYMQTATHRDGFILEMREGSRSRHFQALRPESTSSPRGLGDIFTVDEIATALMAYVSEAPAPGFLKWKRING